MTDTIWLMDMDFHTTFISPSVFRLRGYTLEELRELPLEKHFTTDSFNLILRTISELMTKENLAKSDFPVCTLDLEFYRKDMTTFWSENTFTLIRDINGVPIGFLGVGREISERKRAETALKQSEERFRMLFDKAPMGYQSLDEHGYILEINQKWLDMLGYVRKEVIGKWFGDFLHQDYIEKFKQNFPLFKTIGEIHGIEYVLNKKDNTQIIIALSGKVSYTPNGKFKHTHCILDDITRRKETEIALLESEERYRSVVEQTIEGIYIADYNTKKIIDCNTAFQNLLGYSRKEILNFTIFEFVAHSRADIDAMLEQIVETREPMKLERKYRLKNGSEIDVFVTVNLIKYGGREVICSVIRDITEKKKFELEMEKSRRMESIGMLAGGIAHNFNNLLQTVMGNISLGILYLKPEDQVYKLLTNALNTLPRARELSSRLLTFSKGGSPIKKPGFIFKLLKDIAILATSNTRIHCEFLIQDDLQQIEYDESLIRQALNNIILNSIQSMPDGGKIIFGSEKIEVDESKEENLPLNVLHKKAGSYVRIMIKDHGNGIPKENFQRIFDPFYSTDFNRQGLGLSIAYSIINRHDGFIDLESEIGIGTTFYIYLPLA
jgi:PAS domain S-box-containing protein